MRERERGKDRICQGGKSDESWRDEYENERVREKMKKERKRLRRRFSHSSEAPSLPLINTMGLEQV